MPVIGTGTISLNLQKKLITELEDKALEKNTFTLSPYAFLKSFNTDSTEEELKEEIL